MLPLIGLTLKNKINQENQEFFSDYTKTMIYHPISSKAEILVVDFQN